MKGMFRLSLALATTLCLAACGGSASSESPATPSEEAPAATEAAAFTKRQVVTYDQDEARELELTCMFREDMPNVPLVDLEQYIDLVYQEDSDYTLTGEGIPTPSSGRT